MKYFKTDFDSANYFEGNDDSNLKEVDNIIENLDIFLKNSDQRGRQESLIFDPKGTNESLKNLFSEKGWTPNIRIPNKYNSLGKDIDFYKDNILLEVQFSNYPFLLNNIIRSELFYKNSNILNKSIECLIIITKVHAFPSSNSTLYYEQAIKQMRLLYQNNLFSIPIRLIGLTCNENNFNDIVWTEYSASRYSREVVERENRNLMVRLETPDSFFIFE